MSLPSPGGPIVSHDTDERPVTRCACDDPGVDEPGVDEPGTGEPSTLTVARRFRGPATSGNGGYTAGLLAAQLPGAGAVGAAAKVRLHTPPPLDSAMSVERCDGRAVLRHGLVVVAEAAPATLEVAAVPALPFGHALAAAARYAGFTEHPFPGCVVCGPHRAPGDGLRIFPGRTVPGRTAAAWAPEAGVVEADDTVPTALVWAALDCPGGWTADIAGRPMVLGTITARVDRAPRLGERCVVTGALQGSSGRRTDTATTLYGADGEVLAQAHAVWVEIDAAAFNRVFAPAKPDAERKRKTPADHVAAARRRG